jgi:arylsulfatase A-like enzyme
MNPWSKTGIITSSLLCAFSSSARHDPSVDKPNIIVFLVDDMGWQDTSVPFFTAMTPLNRLYHTPAMEKLASQGMKFTQAYACSVCSPSRVSLMTGMNAARHRVTNWTLERNTPVDVKDDLLDFPLWNVNGMQPVDSVPDAVYATPLPQILKNNGWYTIHCGKAHFGAMNTPSANPVSLGFDLNIAGHAAGAPGSYLGENNFGNAVKGSLTLPWGVPGLEKYHGDSVFLTEALTREAIRAMEKALAANKPFFLYMAHYAVHIPLEADMRFYPKYKAMGLEEPEARYASMIEGMDKSLGDFMAWLDKKGLTANTILLFMSDNGGLSAHARGGKPHIHNAPLNSGKGSAYEGGIREPMIVRWPGKVKPASVCNDCVIIEDFFPTILEMAGIRKYKTVQPLDGKSFVPLLERKGLSSAPRDLYWHFPNKWGAEGPGIGATSTIRSGDWKLIYWYADQRFELFNLRNDLGEKNNLAVQEPAIVRNLAEKLGQYLRQVKAQRPLLKSTGREVPWPEEQFTNHTLCPPDHSNSILHTLTFHEI